MFTDNVVFFKKIRKNTWTFHTCVPKISMTWFTVPEIWSVADGNWQFWVIFHPFPSEKPSKSEFWNYEKNCRRYHYFMHVYQKSQSWCMVPQIWIETPIFCHFASFFCPLRTRKIKILRKWKKYLEISSFYRWSVAEIFVLCYFLPFNPQKTTQKINIPCQHFQRLE